MDKHPLDDDFDVTLIKIGNTCVTLRECYCDCVLKLYGYPRMYGYFNVMIVRIIIRIINCNF